MIIQGKEAMHELVEENRKYTATDEDLEKSQAMEETMKNLKFSMEKVATTLAQFLLPALKWVGDAFLKISDWAAEHPAQLKSAFMALGAAMLFLSASTIAAIGPAIKVWMAHNVGATMATVRFLVMKAAAIAMWLATLGPVGWAAVAFLAIVAAIGLLAIKFQWARDILVAGWSYIRTIMIALWDTVKDVFGAIESGLDLLVGIFTMDGSRISAAWGRVCGFINAAFKKLGAILVFYVLTMAVAVVNTFNLMWGVIKKPAETFFNWIAEKFAAVAKVFKAIASLIPGASAGSQVGSTGGQALMHDTSPGNFLPRAAGAAVAAGGQAPMHDTSPGNFLPRAAGAAVAAGGLAFSPVPKTHIPSPAPSGLVQAPTTTAKPTFDENAFNKAWEEHQQQRLNGYHAGDAIRPSSVNSSNSASTSSMHVDTINVNAPQATDAQGVAGGITGALAEKHSDLVNQADGGMS
jgi:hypothetical protein